MIHFFFSIFPFVVCLFWLILFSLEYFRASSAKRILTLFLFVCTLLYFSHAIYFNHNVHLFGNLESVYAFCTIAVYPLYYLYIYRLTNSKPIPWSKYMILLPAVFTGLASEVFYSMMDDAGRDQFVQWQFYDNGLPPRTQTLAETLQVFRIHFMKYLFAIQLLLVSYFGFKRLWEFDIQLKNFYVDTEHRTLSPIKKLLTIYIIFTIFSTVVNHLGRNFFFGQSWLIAIPSIAFSIMVFAVSYAGFHLNFSIEDFVKDIQQSDTDDAETAIRTATEMAEENNGFSLSPQEKERIRIRFTQLIEEEKVFLRNDLRISDIAHLLGSNRTYISNYINQEMNMSFSDYINLYRVEYAQSLLLSPDHQLSLLEIGELSGFTNETSFYRNFKKIAGSTPKKWLKEQRQVG